MPTDAFESRFADALRHGVDFHFTTRDGDGETALEMTLRYRDVEIVWSIEDVAVSGIAASFVEALQIGIRGLAQWEAATCA